MRRFITAAAIVFLAPSCTAQAMQNETPEYQPVLPGDPSLDAARLYPHTVRYERPGMFMHYEMDMVDWDGRELFELRIWVNREDGEPDRLYIHPVTLGYLGRRLVMPDYTVDVRFAEGHFTGTLVPSAGSNYEPVEYNRSYPHSAFEPAVINYFIAALPLREGYTASLPIFDLSRGSGMYWANIEVLGRETIEVDGVPYQTWKVESRGMKKKTIWVTTEHPYAIKMITQGSFRPWVMQPS